MSGFSAPSGVPKWQFWQQLYETADGSIARLETPDLDDGFEYRITGNRVGLNAAGDDILVFGASFEGAPTVFSYAGTVFATTSLGENSFNITAGWARLKQALHICQLELGLGNNNAAGADFAAVVKAYTLTLNRAAPEKMARLSLTVQGIGSTFSKGDIVIERRRTA
tara:strand:- start:1963 stop:2463 length:501 start_codon:yes stop_codon:yes gene_type:complete